MVESSGQNKRYVRLKREKDIAEKALFNSAMISVLLCILKLAGFWYTGSLLLLAAFFDSMMDVAVSLINSYVQKLSLEAPDQEHPFGHGGFQVISSVIQAIVIVFLGIILANESIGRLLNKQQIFEADPSRFIEGALILVASALGGYVIHFYLGRISRKIENSKQRSLSILADRMHYAGDAWTNLFAAIGMMAVWYFNQPQIDAVFGLLGAVVLFATSWPILKASSRDILHNQVDPKKKEEIVTLVKSVDPRIVSVHRLRARELGPVLFADFHMTLPAEMSLEEAHNIGEKVVRKVKSSYPKSDVMIHLDPDSEPDDDFF